MQKPQQLRAALLGSVPLLQQNPERLTMVIAAGTVVATSAPSLSYEYRYRLELTLADIQQEIETVIVPLLAWLRDNQPEMMGNVDKRRSDFTFASDASGALSIGLQLSERVLVAQTDDALQVTFPGEPTPPASDYAPLQLWVHGELVSEWRR
ncbi:phage tail protein [Candidatus Pantoea deserta]|uniref:Phage tail protein n=2 Tax=Candidatus Pantoea deserta TaxID=1869313 RepID=A0A3N4NWU2_9GAMM|nr:phage tail protein [Pantoea deserta]